ncbi:MAG: cyclase family protein [Candidatus Bathyarchaeia archaeon]
MGLIDLANYKIIDLSAELHPGILKVNGEYVHGRQARRFEIRQFVYEPDKALMHWVETETHIGTHVEMPAHYVEGGKSAAEMPIQTFLGEAVMLRFDFLKPQGGKGQPITVKHLSKVRKGDIVLMWSPYVGDEAPYISSEAATWLAERPIKMLGVQNIGVEESYDLMATHGNLLRNGIPIIEGLANLNAIKKDRVFYIGLPLRVHGLDSSWIRAIALEER